MAGFSMHSSNDSRSTERLVNSTHQGIDRCASLLRALLSPTKIKDKQKPASTKTSKVAAQSTVKRGNELNCGNHDLFVTSLRKQVQTASDSVRYCSVNNKTHLNNKKLMTTPHPPSTAPSTKTKRRKTVPERFKRQILTKDQTKDNNNKVRKRPIPVAMSTPQKDLFQKTGGGTGKTYGEKRQGHPHHVSPAGPPHMMGGHNHHHGPLLQPPPGFPPLPPNGTILPDGQYVPPSWSPWTWAPPCYPMMPPPPPSGPYPPPYEGKFFQQYGDTDFLSGPLSIIYSSQKSLKEAQQKTKFEDEKKELQKQHTAKIDQLKETHEKERDVLTDKLTKLENDLKDIEIKWKEKYCVEAELQHKELCEENQMLKLSLAEKETELLQSQDTLLGIRQYLAHLLLDLQPSQTDKDLSLIPQKDVLILQNIINTGHCGNDDDTLTNSTSGQLSPKPLTTGHSYGGSSTVTGWTTSTEVDFRRDLAALDADIARLQIHFDIASQNEQ